MEMPEENPRVKRKPTLKKAGGKTEEEEGRRVFIESVLKKPHPGITGTFKPDKSNRFHCGADKRDRSTLKLKTKGISHNSAGPEVGVLSICPF
jgi:hypothetical protein